MTPRQKAIVAALAAANVVVILSLVIVITRPLEETGPAAPLLPTEADSLTLSPPAPTARPEETTPTAGGTGQALDPDSCQWQAAQRLAQAGLGGVVTLTPGGTLRFDVVYALPPGQTAEDAAQLVWLVFDVVLALKDDDRRDACESLDRVSLTVLVTGDRIDTRISASVDAADLWALGSGELDEAQFIERVDYDVDDR